MYYKININNIFDSSKLLFSIPVHENQNIINNQIENILNFNPNSKIILHVNKNFNIFNNNLTNYKNVYINTKRFNYIFAKGLLWIHINNFLEAVSLNLNFEYFIIISSNEMFIKNGLNKYIENTKNGLQIVEFDINNKWHNFHKKLEDDEIIKNLLKDLNLNNFYGGQTEGQFYEKDVFKNIANIYLKYFGNKELHNFETEEIIPQTIFKSFNISNSLPFTLQNYSNRIIYTEEFIKDLVENNIIIENNYLDNTLYSCHTGNDCSSIFSIKRVDRNFNNIRNYLSKKGFILNKDIFQLNTYYYSNNSSIIFYSDTYFNFNNRKNITNIDNKIDNKLKSEHHMFCLEINIGYFYVEFEFKLNSLISYNENIGIKIKYPDEYIYYYFLYENNIENWNYVKIPIKSNVIQYIYFIFEECYEYLDIEFRNIKITNVNNILKLANIKKDNIAISLYEYEYNNINDYSINFTNINNMILKELSKLYNIYIFITIENLSVIDKIVNLYKPYVINFIKKNDDRYINQIYIKNIENITIFSKKNNIDIKFIILFRLDSIFNKNISEFNFYINKFNFISYYIPYIDDKISNSIDFVSFPFKYVNDFYTVITNDKNDKNACYLLYSKLVNIIDKNDINFICNENCNNYIRNSLVTYLSDYNDFNNNNGFLFNKLYLLDIFYKNNFSKICKNSNNEYYFYKKYMNQYEPFQWIGLYLDNIEDTINYLKELSIKVTFEIKLLKKFNLNDLLKKNFGLKIHEPLLYLNSWMDDCELDIYKNIQLNIKINRQNQYVILNFDNYNEELEFIIKNFIIILNDIK
jgi:hypothetical protein